MKSGGYKNDLPDTSGTRPRRVLCTSIYPTCVPLLTCGRADVEAPSLLIGARRSLTLTLRRASRWRGAEAQRWRPRRLQGEYLAPGIEPRVTWPPSTRGSAKPPTTKLFFSFVSCFLASSCDAARRGYRRRLCPKFYVDHRCVTLGKKQHSITL